ncbi:hypothetical protein BU23DRAFT_50519 [Bimuria novae-zelandiae CBS 107.79]|uniref:RING-type domain-containing protein n=1 Tax=Bimuria novae-zelandiae CBS 107.79 TaxID=1447943 RepID=A0A6A5UIS4_9PLEO|nr:hypothetical protein BU23DRAFT_50519 [Bimuria novae-zelandiae CBS 107.79]
METDPSTEVYDLLLLVDATSSMSNYLDSLRISFPKIISISKLTNSFSRIGLLAYRDYSELRDQEYPLLEWSGWYSHDDENSNFTVSRLLAKARNLKPSGGADFPEATKTGLARAHALMREEATTIVLLYTDAPPHCWTVAECGHGSHYPREQRYLKREPDIFGGFGSHFADWVEGCKQLSSGTRKAQVFCILEENFGQNALMSGFYLYLSTITRGASIYLTDAAPQSIAHVTVDVLLAWMGVEKPESANAKLPATYMRYKLGTDIKKIKDERDPIAGAFFWSHDPTINVVRDDRRVDNSQWRKNAQKQLEENLTTKPIDSEVLKKFLPKKKTKAMDFAQQYLLDPTYKEIVIEELTIIIETDVTSIALNPVFGSLWRAVCNDRDHPARGYLIAAFSASIDEIGPVEEKTRMRGWLEESYDYAADILDALEAVPEDQRLPCVFLDPTIEFRSVSEKAEKFDEENEDHRQITAFRRDELLDIGRSCDGHILRRLGKVLTRLTYAESLDTLPAHIAASTIADVPRIPLSLASQEQGWKFFKILLHTVLPGTMLSTRPAMVLAALAMRIGIKPLFEPASSALMFWRDKWNNTGVPENWNVGCLGLLLDADDEYQKEMSNRGTTTDDSVGILLPTDRELFSQLVAYKLVEANLSTTLVADVSWTPEKTQLPVGHVVTCTRCKHPRSVTVMAEKSGGQCGLCIARDWKDAAHKKRALETNITEDGNLSWVECSVPTCRAQYVCYNPEDLNVRAKCHYCRRNQGVAPTLECERCLSRVIWPREWRAAAATPFHCVACLDGRKTVVEADTTAQQICQENGLEWLLRNEKETLKQPFQGSIFRTISTIGPKAFLANVRVLPTYEGSLTLRGKPIQNKAALRSDLESWIYRRSAEKTPCSLCFSEFPNARLLPACRRRGCHQRICQNCLHGWYGQNHAGSIINPAALFCPFCRRPPATRTLAAYGKGIHAVGGLMAALNEKGQWIHAWCGSCSKACRLMERECARGAPEPVERFTCDDCKTHALEQARIAEEEARRAAERAARIAARHDAAEQRQRRLEAERELSIAARARAELEYPVKKCPGCGVRSQKIYGCDHVRCPIKTCGVHWCWGCGKAFTQRVIFEHMSDEHGGYNAEGAWGNVRYGFGALEDDEYDNYDDHDHYDEDY